VTIGSYDMLALGESMPIRLCKERETSWYTDALLQCGSLRLAHNDEHYYAQGSVVPADPWTSCSEHAFLPYSLHPRDFDRRSVMHFRVDHALSKHIAAEMARISDLPLLQAAKDEISLRLRDEVVAWAVNEFPIGADRQVFHVGFNAPGFLTGTIDQNAAKLIGIHIDSWDGTTLRSRRSCRYRLTLNLGPGTRWLLFAPDSLDQLVARVGPLVEDDDFVLSASELLRRQAITMVRALRLLPGEGYLAPTDAMYHDVSTAWTDRGSLNIQMLFVPPS
jgi:hypothetical protein